MNRLSPLIVRHAGPYAPPLRYEWGPPPEQPAPPRIGDDLRLVLTAWLGGLVFFGTLFA